MNDFPLTQSALPNLQGNPFLRCLMLIVALAFGGLIAAGIAQPPTPPPRTVDNHNQYLLAAVLWYQTSGEMRALYYQGYQLARLRLDEKLKDNPANPAIVLDLDETVFDNSAFSAWQISASRNWSKPSWDEWVQQENAVPVPGAVAFLRYAASRGVEVFYITNRLEDGTYHELVPTKENLQKYLIPFADKDHLLLQSTPSGNKEDRRRSVAANHTILLLCGDNLNDFADFGGKSVADRNALADNLQTEFGNQFIVFPNPMYGAWDDAVFLGVDKPDDGKKDQLRHQQLRPAALKGAGGT